MKAVIVVCGLLMLGGCASGGASNPPWLALNSRCAKLSGDQELSMNLADDMAKEGKLHASLANLQSLPERYGQVQLRKARLYRQLGRSEAELLAALAEHRDVHIWLPQASPAGWEAIAAEVAAGPVPRALDRSVELVRHPLLAGLGRDARELQRTLMSVATTSACVAPWPWPASCTSTAFTLWLLVCRACTASSKPG